MSVFYCSGCEEAIERITRYTEDDVNWTETRCEACGSDDLELINLSWAVDQVRTALRYFEHTTSSRGLESRLGVAIEELEYIL